MSESLKRNVTQEELDQLYSTVSPPVSRHGAENFDSAALPSGAGVPDLFGIHVQKDRTVIIGLSKKSTIERELALNVGFENVEALVEELEKILEGRSKASVYLTVTGKPSSFIVARLPKMARAMMLKAFKLQFKTQTGEEREDFQYLPLIASKKLGEVQTEYLVATVEKALVEKLSGYLKKLKVKVVAWDLDLLCFVRAANFLWSKYNDDKGTRFLVLLEWDHCHLLIANPDGKLICPKLPIGIQSFLEHLLASRSAVVPKSLDEKDWQVLPSDPIEVRQRKLLASQAIHEVYMPLAQQIKTHLYSGCNEHAIPLPTHLAVVSPGKQIFHVAESLAADLGIGLIPVEATLPSESVAALGAALWDKEPLRLNFAVRKVDRIKQLREMWSGLKGRMGMGSGESAPGTSLLPGNAVLVLVLPLLVCGLLGSYPLYKRYVVSSKLDSLRAELVRMETEKARIKKAQEREFAHDRRQGLAKMIEKRKANLSRGIEEIFHILPAEIKLMSIAFRENVLTLKGLATEPTSLEKLLHDALELKYLDDPTPLGIKREKAGTEFEITFKFRPS